MCVSIGICVYGYVDEWCVSVYVCKYRYVCMAVSCVYAQVCGCEIYIGKCVCMLVHMRAFRHTWQGQIPCMWLLVGSAPGPAWA